ncbi:TPM domain-containing protein, partial [Acinetobacter baumannii]|nr:TPM domain-containing protein [Acinetobacter baumannii]
LSQNTVQLVEQLNGQLEANCQGAQIGVLTVEYTGNLSTEEYAVQAFNAWGIGSAKEDNGVLILLVMESPLYKDGDYYLTIGDGF